MSAMAAMSAAVQVVTAPRPEAHSTAPYQITAGLQAEDRSVLLTLMRWSPALCLGSSLSIFECVWGNALKSCSASTTVTSKADTITSRMRMPIMISSHLYFFDSSCAHFCINHVCAIYDSWLAYLQMSNTPASTDPDSWHYTTSILPLCERLHVCAPVKWIYLCVGLFVCW